jgi:hypothetical protein
MANFNIDEYATVNERIQEFYKKHKDGAIQTEIVSNQNGIIIFKAYVYKTPEDTRPTIGHAMEKEGSTFINKTSHIENCETSAVGRALALMGFCIKKSIASKEEVQNAQLNQKTTPPKLPPKTPPKKETPPPKITGINQTQQKQLFAIAGNDAKVVKDVLLKHNLTQTKEILTSEFESYCKEVEEAYKKSKAQK